MEYTVKFIEQKKEGEELYSFRFEKPQELSWIDGQHVQLRFKKALENDKGFRPLSIASSQTEDTMLFILKISEPKSKYKESLLNLQKGDEMVIVGPFGRFILQENKTNHIFIAGGVGIAPFRPILYNHPMTYEENAPHIELLYAAHEGHFAFQDELNSLAKDNEFLAIHYVHHRDEIEKMLSELYEKYKNDANYYICGTPGMVDMCHELLKLKGVPKEQILLDTFTGYKE